MRVNVTKLELAMQYVPEDDTDPARKHLTFYLQTEEMEHQIAPMLHGTWVIDRFIAQCRGLIKWYDKVSFDDVGYQIRVDSDALQVWHRVGKGSEIFFFTFPMGLLADVLAKMYVSETQPESSYAFTEEQLAEIKKSHWPKANLEFASIEAKERFMTCIRGENNELDEKNVVELREQIRGLMRIARNYSNGDYTVVTLQIDFAPHSFYFTIYTADSYRVMNGGIIAHKMDRDGSEYYTYSTHT